MAKTFYAFVSAFCILFFCGCGGGNYVKIQTPACGVIYAEKAVSPLQHEKGLMFRDNLDKNKGMLFIFPQEDFRAFWMKNTLIDLDIIFIGADKKVLSVSENVPKSGLDTTDDKVARAYGSGQYVLELNAGRARGCGINKDARLAWR